MDANKLFSLLTDVQAGRLDVNEAVDRLRTLPYDDHLEYARLDLHRSVRQGMPEVIFGQNKTAPQIIGILERLAPHHERILATRISPEQAADIQAALPAVGYDATSRLLWLAQSELPPPPDDAPYVLVASGGTSDMAVSEEAAQTAEFFGNRVERAYDVGVAGIHRLLNERERLMQADVVISVAGMEGALTSVIGGLVACPVVGVPTSVGYGASFNGVAALLSMLNSCASGVAVVNIDNGFGAAVYAHTILRRITRRET